MKQAKTKTLTASGVVSLVPITVWSVDICFGAVSPGIMTLDNSTDGSGTEKVSVATTNTEGYKSLEFPDGMNFSTACYGTKGTNAATSTITYTVN